MRSARESKSAQRLLASQSPPICAPAGLNQPIRSVLDHDAVCELAKVNNRIGEIQAQLADIAGRV
jgi:hypothetical protein